MDRGEKQMGLIGKIVGGTIGFALGGPLGAIAGAVFGHAFDSSPGQQIDSQHVQPLSSIEESQLAFFVGTFSMLAKLAAADGRVKTEEISTVESFAINDLGLSAQSRTIAFNIFRTAIDSPARFEDFAHQFYEQFNNQPQMIEMMIDILLRVGVADGVLHASEQALIERAVDIFNFDQNRYNQLKFKYAGVSDQAYHVLGCNPDDSIDTIKKRYRKLVQDYHPDKIASKGLPEEFNQLAHDKFREIQDAYDTIKKERNLK
jgi:DnaJ like chaperone protein